MTRAQIEYNFGTNEENGFTPVYDGVHHGVYER